MCDRAEGVANSEAYSPGQEKIFGLAGACCGRFVSRWPRNNQRAFPECGVAARVASCFVGWGNTSDGGLVLRRLAGTAA